MESSKSRKRASKVKGNGGGTTGLGVHGGSTNNTYIARSPRDRKSSRGGNHRGSSGGAASCSNRRLTQSQIKKLNRVSNAYGLRPDAANGLGLPMSMYNKGGRRGKGGGGGGGSPRLHFGNKKVNMKKYEKLVGITETGTHGAFHMNIKGPKKTPKSIGRLWVRVAEGRDLEAMDRGGTSDPYVEVKLLAPEIKTWVEMSHKTEIVSKTLNPRWQAKNEVLWMPPSLNMVLVFVVWDFDNVGFDDFMGELILPLKALNPYHVYDRWHPLKTRDNKTRAKGELRVLISFMPHGERFHNVSLPFHPEDERGNSIENGEAGKRKGKEKAGDKKKGPRTDYPHLPTTFTTVEEVYLDPIMWGAFLSCVKSQMCGELTVYYDEISRLKQSLHTERLIYGTKEWKKRCNMIFHKYIKDGAGEEINISAREKQRITLEVYGKEGYKKGKKRQKDSNVDGASSALDDDGSEAVLDTCPVSIFDESYHEVTRLLNTNCLHKFIEGDFLRDGRFVAHWASCIRNFESRPDMQFGAIQALLDGMRPEDRAKLHLRGSAHQHQRRQRREQSNNGSSD